MEEVTMQPAERLHAAHAAHIEATTSPLKWQESQDGHYATYGEDTFVIGPTCEGGYCAVLWHHSPNGPVSRRIATGLPDILDAAYTCHAVTRILDHYNAR